MNPLLERITINPDICSGKPCIRGTRIWVSVLLDLLAGGMTTDDVIAEYPYLEKSDIHAAIAYGAEMSRYPRDLWSELTVQQFLSGYSAPDSIYDTNN